MNIKEGFGKNVTFHKMDSYRTEDRQTDSHDQRRFQTCLDQTSIKRMTKVWTDHRGRSRYDSIIEVVTDIIQEVIKGMGDRIIITTDGESLEIKIIIEIGLGHMKDRIKVEGMVEALVTVDQGLIKGSYK